MAKVPDNFTENFPARMSDGRFITDYSSNCFKNVEHKKDMTGWEYRIHLINNAEKIMGEINEQNEKLYGCEECNGVNIPSQKANQVCTGENCNVEEVDPNGIGIEQLFQ